MAHHASDCQLAWVPLAVVPVVASPVAAARGERQAVNLRGASVMFGVVCGAQPPILGVLGLEAIAIPLLAFVRVVLVHRPALVHRVLRVQPVVVVVGVTLNPDTGRGVLLFRLARGRLLLAQHRPCLLCGGVPQRRCWEAPLPFRKCYLEPFAPLLRRSLDRAYGTGRHIPIRLGPLHAIARSKTTCQLVLLLSRGHSFQPCVSLLWLRLRLRPYCRAANRGKWLCWRLYGSRGLGFSQTPL